MTITRRGLFDLLKGSSPQTSGRGFLEDFYRNRKPQELPSIVLHPTAVEYAHEQEHSAELKTAARYGRPVAETPPEPKK